MKKILFIITILISVSIFGSAASKKIVVDLTKQVAYAYSGKRLIYKGWISSGKREFRTPTGTFKILKKEKEHISNEWPDKIDPKTGKKGGAKMPYMLRLTWSGVAIHLGFTPNHPASHGCIRAKDGFAQKLYNWARIGTKVIVKGKPPKRVTRRGKGFIDKTQYAKKKSKKRYITKREKLVQRYARLSYKKINRILKKNYNKKQSILASNKSKYRKIRELRKIKWIVGVLKDAKVKKYYKKHNNKKVAKKRFKRRVYKRLTRNNISKLKYNFFN